MIEEITNENQQIEDLKIENNTEKKKNFNGFLRSSKNKNFKQKNKKQYNNYNKWEENTEEEYIEEDKKEYTNKESLYFQIRLKTLMDLNTFKDLLNKVLQNEDFNNISYNGYDILSYAVLFENMKAYDHILKEVVNIDQNVIEKSILIAINKNEQFLFDLINLNNKNVSKSFALNLTHLMPLSSYRKQNNLLLINNFVNKFNNEELGELFKNVFKYNNLPLFELLMKNSLTFDFLKVNKECFLDAISSHVNSKKILNILNKPFMKNIEINHDDLIKENNNEKIIENHQETTKANVPIIVVKKKKIMQNNG